MSRNVAVVGLGAMGLPMAERLAELFPVTGFDVAPERLALAAESGIETSVTAADAVSGADSVLVAVRTPEQLHGLLFGEGGIIPHLCPGTSVVLTSTVGTEGLGETVGRLAETEIHLVDAPLSGGPLRARSGDLLIVVGAEPTTYEENRSLLEHLGSTVSVVGDKPGDGQALKTVNQLLCGVHIAAVGEALALADALGLDRSATLGALTAGAASSFMLENRGPRALQAYDEDGAEVLSRLDIFVKDMGIVGKAARAAHLSTPVAAAAEQLFLLGETAGLGAEDDSAVLRVIAPQRSQPAS